MDLFNKRFQFGGWEKQRLNSMGCVVISDNDNDNNNDKERTEFNFFFSLNGNHNIQHQHSLEQRFDVFPHQSKTDPEETKVQKNW